MTPQDVILHYGSQLEAAKALDLAQSSISLWVKAQEIPWMRQLDIERMSGGKLCADPEQRKRELARKKRAKVVA